MDELNEHKSKGFDFSTFIADSNAVLLNPKDYFSRINLSGGFIEPVIKVLIYGVIIGLLKFLWTITGLSYASGYGLFGGGAGVFALFGSIIRALLSLFIGGAILLIISSIFKGNADYEANARIVAALMVISVVQAVFGFFDGLNLYLSAIVSIAISLWGLYITYIALTIALKNKEKGVMILMIIFAVIITITSFTGIAAKKLSQSVLNDSYSEEGYTSDKALKLVEKMSGGELKAEEMKKAMAEQQKELKEYNKELDEGVDSLSQNEETAAADNHLTTSTDQNKKVFETEYISVSLDNNWTITSSGAQNNNDYSVFSYVVNSSGDIYNDFNHDHKQIGEITETKIDGMPAITRIQEYMSNKKMRSRAYLINDGNTIIAVTIAAPQEVYNDDTAKSIAKNISVLHKGDNVTLPTTK